MEDWSDFYGPNAAYALEIFERYRQDPGAVDAQTRAFFEQNPPPGWIENQLSARNSPVSSLPERAAAPTDASSASAPLAVAPGAAGLDARKIAAAQRLADGIRWYGHRGAHLDPLGSSPPDDPALHPETYQLSEEDLRAIPASVMVQLAGSGVDEPAGAFSDYVQCCSVWEAIEGLRRIYSGTVGHDYLQIHDATERYWLRQAAENGRFSAAQKPIDDLALLQRLTEVEAFEHFLQRSFAARTRFSIEGLDTLIPMLDELIGCAAEAGIYNILIGMAHRGRLNVLAHVLDKPVDQILAEFQDPLRRRALQNEPDGWLGDVKYHAGARLIVDPDQDPSTIDLTIQMAPNPSHLEAINPVVAGMARAAGTRADQPGPAIFDPSVTLPIVIHGDAAFNGEGVVAETLNLYRLPGYTTGGTIHIIANNQIGFTTSPGETRSTLFASDLAKGFRIPILHVNADDPEGVLLAARTAFAYREKFRNDFLIDLVGYRRLGHNEGDEPAFTQPEMYRRIHEHPSVRKLWAARLAERGEITLDQAETMYQDHLKRLQSALEALDPEALREPIPPPPPPGAARKVRTAVPAERLERLNRDLMQVPEGFTVHPRLARIRQRREQLFASPQGASSDVAIDWGTAEDLALGSILEDGVPVRLTGQDSERGTFSHRHAVLHDALNGQTYTPLQAIPEARAAFEIYNSPLSEYAALAFEFGYDIQARERLVIWEAQYGDFINNAQTVVDEFIVSARDKWGQLPALVLLLPHGYEGQGPDHSSARLERFLDLAADNNLRVANCTTAANYFHLLRRQAALLAVDPLPLVVMTPKSLLRHPLVASPLRDFSEGGWQAVIDRTPPAAKGASGELPPPEDVRRLALGSGKIIIDLLTSDLLPQHPETGIARLEQLAPFPTGEVKALLERYPALEEVVWVQEEPENMGARRYVRHFLDGLAAERGLPLRQVSRPRSSSPAEGSNNLHAYNQKRLIEQVFDPATPAPVSVSKAAVKTAAAKKPAEAKAKANDKTERAASNGGKGKNGSN